MSELKSDGQQAEPNMKASHSLTDDQEVDALAIAESLLLGGHETDKSTGEILPQTDGTPYTPVADSWQDYSEQNRERPVDEQQEDSDEFPDAIPEQFLGEQAVNLESMTHTANETAAPHTSWWKRTFSRTDGVKNTKHNSNTHADNQQQPTPSDVTGNADSSGNADASGNIINEEVISPDSYRDECNSLVDANLEQNTPPQFTPQFHAPTSKRTIISLAVAIILGASSLGLSGYQAYRARSNISTAKLITALEAKVDQRIEQITDSISVNAVNSQQADNTLTIDVQRLETDLKAGMQQLNELKEQTSKMREDVANGVQAGAQAKELTEQLSRTIATLNESLTVTANEVAALKKNRQVSPANVSAPAAEVARMPVTTAVTHKTKSVPVTRRPVNTAVSPVAQPGVTTLLGYKLFSVDDWGGVLLVTMTQGDDVLRLQVGDFLQDWRVDTVDLNNKSVVFVKGAMRTTVIASGG